MQVANRQIVLDTETTGLTPEDGHRIIEIGCVELINRRITGNHYHQYLQPERSIDAGAVEVHGITEEFLKDKPHFRDIAESFLEFIKGAELIIHNAPFDVGFINHELRLLDSGYGTLEGVCTVIDTLDMARKLHAGQRNSLDALCKRYSIDNSQRSLHGALLDAEILADVYLAMTGGQVALLLDGNSDSAETKVRRQTRYRQQGLTLPVLEASPHELAEHAAMLEHIRKTGGSCAWDELEGS